MNKRLRKKKRVGEGLEGRRTESGPGTSGVSARVASSCVMWRLYRNP